MYVYSSHAAVAPKKVTAQSKTMGRIKFGSDDEQDKPKEAEAKPVVADNVETVKFNGNINDDEGIKTGRRCKILLVISFCFLLFLAT